MSMEWSAVALIAYHLPRHSLVTLHPQRIFRQRRYLQDEVLSYHAKPEGGIGVGKRSVRDKIYE